MEESEGAMMDKPQPIAGVVIRRYESGRTMHLFCANKDIEEQMKLIIGEFGNLRWFEGMRGWTFIVSPLYRAQEVFEYLVAELGAVEPVKEGR